MGSPGRAPRRCHLVAHPLPLWELGRGGGGGGRMCKHTCIRMHAAHAQRVFARRGVVDEEPLDRHVESAAAVVQGSVSRGLTCTWRCMHGGERREARRTASCPSRRALAALRRTSARRWTITAKTTVRPSSSCKHGTRFARAVRVLCACWDSNQQPPHPPTSPLTQKQG